MSRMNFKEALALIKRMRNRGISKNTVDDGYANQGVPEDEPYYLVAQITALENNDESDPDALPCYGFKLWNERDPTLITDPDITAQAIFQDDDLVGGNFDLLDPSLVSSDGHDPFDTLGAAYEMSGNTNVPTDGSVYVLLWPARGARHFIFSYPPGNDDNLIFPATLDDKNQTDSQWLYSFTKDSYGAGYVQTVGSELKGTLPAYITMVHTQTSDTLDPDIWTIEVIGATGGSFTLNENSLGAGSDLAYNASDGTINGSLAHFTCSSSSSGNTTTHVFTATSAASPQTIILASAADDPLLPVKPHYAAAFRNNVAMSTPVSVHLKQAWSGKPKVTSKLLEHGDDDTEVNCVLHLAVVNPYDGSYKLRFLSTDAWKTIKYNATASDIQTALSTLLTCTVTEDGDSTSDHRKFTITITADFDDHRLLIDKTLLIGTTWYIVIGSNGNFCDGAIGGLDPKYMASYTPAPDPVLSLTHNVTATGSISDVWTLRVTHASSGSYNLKFDGGSSINTAYNACPTITGCTVVSNVDGSCTITANDTSTHTLSAFPAKLRSSVPPQFPGVKSDNCVQLYPAEDTCDT